MKVVGSFTFRDPNPRMRDTYWHAVMGIDPSDELFVVSKRPHTEEAWPDYQEVMAGNGCSGCQAKAIVKRWLGVRWHGKPAPLRLLAAIIHGDDPGMWPGCGCMVKPKAAWLAFKVMIRSVKHA